MYIFFASLLFGGVFFVSFIYLFNYFDNNPLVSSFLYSIIEWHFVEGLEEAAWFGEGGSNCELINQTNYTTITKS